MKQIHIIGTPAPESETAQQMMIDFTRQALDTLGSSDEVAITSCRMDEIVYLISNDECRMIDHKNQADLADYDLVWFRGKLAVVMSDVATVANYLKAKGVLCLNSFFASRRGVGKINQMYILATHQLPIPKTVSAGNDYLAKYIAEFLNYPLIVKDTHGSHGLLNYLVNSEDELRGILRTNPEVRFMAQEYITGEGDYRILFAGPECIIIRRLGSSDTHLNNTSQGAEASLISPEEFPPQIIAEARQFAEICEYEIAGVDVIIDKVSGQHYFLEINSQPQLATGVFLDEKKSLLGKYFQSLMSDKN